MQANRANIKKLNHLVLLIAALQSVTESQNSETTERNKEEGAGEAFELLEILEDLLLLPRLRVLLSLKSLIKSLGVPMPNSFWFMLMRLMLLSSDLEDLTRRIVWAFAIGNAKSIQRIAAIECLAMIRLIS